MKSFHFSLFLHTSVTWSTVILKCNTFFLTDWVYYDIIQSIWSPVEVCSSLDCCLLLNLFSCWVWINRVGYRATFLQYPDSEPYPILRQALWLHHESMRKKKWEYEQDCCWINSQAFIQFHGLSPRNVLWVLMCPLFHRMQVLIFCANIVRQAGALRRDKIKNWKWLISPVQK